MTKVFFFAPSSSVHSYKWINSFEKNFGGWLSLTKDNNVNNYIFRPNFFLFIFKLIKEVIFKKERRIILHSHVLGWHSIVGYLFSVIFQRPHFITVWGSDIVFIESNNKLKKFLKKIVIKKAQLITTDAEHMMEKLKLLNVNIGKVQRINFGVDLIKFDKMNKGINEFCILSARNFEPVYDIKTIIFGAYKFATTHKDLSVKLILAGGGSQLEELTNLVNSIKEEKINLIIKFTGKYGPEELGKLISEADVYVSASLSDAGISSTTAECMLSKLPVIVSNTGENDKWICHNENGFLFEAGSIESLNNCFDNFYGILINKPEILNIIINSAALTIYDKNYRINEMMKMLDIYENFTLE